MDGKRKTTRRQRIFALAIGAVALITAYALVAVSVTPVKYNFAAGEVAPATITASREVEDTVSLQAARDAAREAVEANPIYSVDENISERVRVALAAYFDSMAGIPGTLKEAYIYTRIASFGGVYSDYERSYDPSKVKWEDVLTELQKQYIRDTMQSPGMPDAAVYAVATMSESDITAMHGVVLKSVDAALENGISAEYVASVLDGIQRDIESQYTSGELAYIAALPVERYLEANKVMDEQATEQKAIEAEAAVPSETYMYQVGQNVVVAGDVVTKAQLAMLETLGVVGGQETDYTLYISMFVYAALLFVLYGFYLIQFEHELVADTRRLMMLAAVTVVTVGLAVLFARFDARVIPAFLGTLLACALLSQRTALALTVFLAFLTAPICAGSAGLFSTSALTTVAASVLGGSACVFALNKPMRRTSLILAGLAAGLVAAVIAAMREVIGTATFSASLLGESTGFAIGSGLLAGVLTIGTLPIWEAVFRASTASKLLELSNPNHPLLKRLTLEAPGTYHHSILTANLSEAGADAVGASTLLCRVGAYYHDIGKLKDPMFFGENQKGENPHDTLDPRESARIITGHVTYGLELAKKYKLPREVVSIIVQHHGSTQIKFFAHKALEAGIEPDPEQFRYPGSRPTTREAGVVMLADCVEAAVRSMGDPTLDQIREMISKLIRDRYNDGQLDDTPLSRQDLNHIAQAFTGVYEGALHERVKYPGQE